MWVEVKQKQKQKTLETAFRESALRWEEKTSNSYWFSNELWQTF